MTYNAITVLTEFCENEHCFQILMEEAIIKKLV